MHRVERQVEADEKQPEMPFAQPLAQQAAGRFGKPIVNGREDHEYQRANQHVMEMRDHEVGIVQLPVERGAGQHDARQPGDQELEEERDAEQHRRGEAEFSAPHRARSS